MSDQAAPETDANEDEGEDVGCRSGGCYERETCYCDTDPEDEDDNYCPHCGGSGERVPDHCCDCGGGVYDCTCCGQCGGSVETCNCPLTVHRADGTTLTV